MFRDRAGQRVVLRCDMMYDPPFMFNEHFANMATVAWQPCSTETLALTILSFGFPKSRGRACYWISQNHCYSGQHLANQLFFGHRSPGGDQHDECQVWVCCQHCLCGGLRIHEGIPCGDRNCRYEGVDH
mmetsp:Transcript_71422/g.190412  ORF Transcript_71422/g.190412 Transcript_71422/m.190412 type:complete len:129 (+) Transcript_71422:3317-3703(+)